MGTSGRDELTQTLLSITGAAAESGAPLDRIFEAAHAELRRIAGGLMRGERRDHTLQPTALLNEAYMRLADESRLAWENRAHFFAIAARAMRQILVEHARRRNAEKRGGGWERVTLTDHAGLSPNPDLEILDLEKVLTRLGEMDESMARIVELRFFGGMTSKEVAHVLGVTRQTVQNKWRVAKMWLATELSGGGEA